MHDALCSLRESPQSYFTYDNRLKTQKILESLVLHQKLSGLILVFL